MEIAVLALQGAFIEHEKMLERLGVPSFELRQKSDLDRHFDGLIIPGGESTVQKKLLRELDMYDTIKDKIENGLPVFGTCAGMILLAKKIENCDEAHLATMDIEVRRNAYGRQLGSFYTEAKFADMDNVPMTFIRAPFINSVGKDAKVLATVDSHIVAARQGNQLAVSFHPELNDDLRIHEYFISMVKNA